MSTIRMWRLRFDDIEPVECNKVTAAFVWPIIRNGSRKARSSRYTTYYETWDDAYVELLREAEQSLDNACLNLQNAQKDYDRIKDMKPPKEVS